ncbi:MAG: class I SAM-dependent methyltransferase [Candidatus Euphemobacter frigidus]|nr:class I SAM-dependent methyltransferase [Candidatus Euphemobacter frigidus]MDP8275314.1 class I SAM-dependent methyltransferase [Candidatus Euphemobacter frigidus]
MERYKDNIKARWTGRYDASIAMVGDVTAKKILDIGCAFGWFEKIIKDGKCELITGMDINRYQLIRGARSVSEAYFIQAGVPELPFKAKQFDIVVMWETLEHLPRKEIIPALKSIRHVLNRCGRFYFSTPKFDLRSTLTDPAWYFGHRHYTGKALKRLLEQGGFRLVRIRSGGAFFEVFNMILFYPFKWLASLEVPGKAFIERKRRKEYSRRRGWSTYFVEARID